MYTIDDQAEDGATAMLGGAGVTDSAAMLGPSEAHNAAF